MPSQPSPRQLIEEFQPPSPREMRAALALLAPFGAMRPRVLGLEHIPAERPLLFVGNHTLYGMIDTPFLFAELYRRKGIFLRSLGDHAHFRVPVWRDLLARFGVVDGTREHCARLMRAGACVLVFPGGGREVMKRKGERYRLLWKDRLGFVRLAVAHGCTIVPFAAVGVEHGYDILFDADDLMATPLGKLLGMAGLRGELVPPIARGVGLTPLPRPERQYLWFAPAIETRGLGDAAGDEARLRALRDQVRAAVEDGIVRLHQVRERDQRRARRRTTRTRGSR
jgi:1-acyl-sn-glycerol-3-phosphate acyltransferase